MTHTLAEPGSAPASTAPMAVLGGQVLTGPTAEQATARLLSPDFEAWAGQVAACGSCARPVRLVGQAATVDARTGEVLSTYDTRQTPDGVLYVRCGNRRAAVCPSCSYEYKGDMWHLLAAGSGGGMKGVPVSVGFHPQVFATLTAPSFGPVHTQRGTSSKGRPLPCRTPRRDHPRLCAHGRSTSCPVRHGDGDQALGTPLCADCYDYTGHVVWQWHAPELWRRFTIQLGRELAASLGIPQRALRERARLSFAKVAEFQRRGLVHFHAIIRLDGAPTDDDPFPSPRVPTTAQQLAELIRTAAARVRHDAALTPDLVVRRLRFGVQVDARPVHPLAERDTPDHDNRQDGTGGPGVLHPQRVAAYIAKYATKACEDFGIPSGITGPAMAETFGLSAHPTRIIATAAQLAEHGGEPYEPLRKWLHMLGFRGHFATKSRRYSTTLARLRGARRRHALHRLRQQRADRDGVRLVEHERDDDPDGDDSTLVIGNWTFNGMGWLNQGDAALAAESAALAREHHDRTRAAKRGR